jgi:hypothetical protein
VFSVFSERSGVATSPSDGAFWAKNEKAFSTTAPAKKICIFRKLAAPDCDCGQHTRRFRYMGGGRVEASKGRARDFAETRWLGNYQAWTTDGLGK